jgi:hypothetical protein
VNVSSFILCDSATIRPDGTFDVVRGGLAEVMPPAFPAEAALSAVLVLEIGPDETGPQRLEIFLRDANAKKLQAWPYAFTLQANQRGANLVLNLKGLRLPEPAEYLLSLRVNGKHLGPAKTLRATLGPA